MPPPQCRLRGWRCWKLTIAAMAGRRVSSRRYQLVHQASRRYDSSATSAIVVGPKLQACARIEAWRCTRRSLVRGSRPPACSKWRVKSVQLSTSRSRSARSTRGRCWAIFSCNATLPSGGSSAESGVSTSRPSSIRTDVVLRPVPVEPGQLLLQLGRAALLQAGRARPRGAGAGRQMSRRTWGHCSREIRYVSGSANRRLVSSQTLPARSAARSSQSAHSS